SRSPAAGCSTTGGTERGAAVSSLIGIPSRSLQGTGAFLLEKHTAGGPLSRILFRGGPAIGGRLEGRHHRPGAVGCPLSSGEKKWKMKPTLNRLPPMLTVFMALGSAAAEEML